MAIKFLCVCNVPFGLPVEPEEYIHKHISSILVLATSIISRSLSNSLKEISDVALLPETIIFAFDLDFLIAFLIVWYLEKETIIASASESSIIYL